MTSPDEMSDSGIEGVEGMPPPFLLAPTHEEHVEAIREAVERLEVAVATIDARSTQTARKVDDLSRNFHGFSRMFRTTSGPSMGNLVQQIFQKVQKLD